MSQHITVKCDNCGKVKQESNHWWEVVKVKSTSFVVRQGGGDLGDIPIYDMCGESCVLKAISTLIGGGDVGGVINSNRSSNKSREEREEMLSAIPKPSDT